MARPRSVLTPIQRVGRFDLECEVAAARLKDALATARILETKGIPGADAARRDLRTALDHVESVMHWTVAAIAQMREAADA